jgi:hypothetical protein
MMTFNYIRNQIRQYRKSDLIDYCFKILAQQEGKVYAVWDIFIILKWAHEHGEQSQPLKTLTDQGFNKISKGVYRLNEEHTTHFIKSGGISKYFLILHSQQFYLQKYILKETLATQLKLFVGIKHKYDVNKLFEQKTGISIPDLIFFFQTIWVIMYARNVEGSSISYRGHLSEEHLRSFIDFRGQEKVHDFLRLMVLNPETAVTQIGALSQNIHNTEWHSLAKTFCTMYPLHFHDNKIKIVHDSVFNYAVNFYIYDFMKSNEFATDFGKRIEEYVDFGLKETGYKYLNENELKKLLPGSKVVDYFIDGQNVFLECKAVELSALPAVNPTDKSLYNSLEDNIIKAYAKQMLCVANQLDKAGEYFGLIITYKEFFTSQFTELYEISKKDIPDTYNIKLLPPENVFIIDFTTVR